MNREDLSNSNPNQHATRSMNIKPPANPVRNVLVFFMTFGLGFSMLTAYQVVSSRRFVDHAAHAQGVVVALRKHMGHKDSTWPIVAFTTASGARIEFQSNVPNRSLLPVGTRVDVLYDTRDPSNASIDSWLDLWGLAFFFGIMSLFFVGLGLTILVLVKKRMLRVQSSISNPASDS